MYTYRCASTTLKLQGIIYMPKRLTIVLLAIYIFSHITMLPLAY